MPNFPSIYLELQELWKRFRGSANDISSLTDRVTNAENNITSIDDRVSSVEDDIADGIEVSTYSPNITGNGLISNPIKLSDDIDINSVTASYVNTSQITASDMILYNDITVLGTASIAMLNTVNQTSLQVGDKYITIMSGSNTHVLLDGAGILYGSGSSDITTGDQNSVAHLVYRKGNAPSDYTSDYLEVYPGLRVNGVLTSSGNVYAPQITASVGFKGDGSQITNITGGSANFPNFQADVRNQISVTSDLTYTAGQIGLSENPTVTTLTASSISASSNITASNFRAANIPVNNLATNIVVADSNGVLGYSSINTLGSTIANSTTGSTLYTSGTSTFTVPTNATFIKITCIGGGGGGSQGALNQAGTGGGGGAYATVILKRDKLPSTLTCTVGTGGSRGLTSGTDPSDGGDTYVKNGTQYYCMARGGNKGIKTSSNASVAGGKGQFNGGSSTSPAHSEFMEK